jgi:1,4-dihydroxy-2-naphthoate octaprenyltransferase
MRSERLVPASAVTRRRIWIDLLLYPTHTFPTAAAPVAIGFALALRHHIYAPLPAFLGFLASWLVHVAGVFFNNYELLARHPDNREHPELVQALRDGQLTPATLRRATLVCLLLAALTGPYLLAVAGWPVVLFGLIGIGSSLSYAGGPLAYARTGLADIVFFVMFGIVAVIGTYYVEAAAVASAAGNWHAALGAIPTEAWLLGLPAGALIVNVLLIDDIRDRDADAAKGWRTGTVRFGRDWTRMEYVVLSCFAYAAPVWFWWQFGFSAWIFLPLLTLPAAFAILHMIDTKTRLEDLVPATPRAAFLALLYSLLLAIGIAAT